MPYNILGRYNERVFKLTKPQSRFAIPSLYLSKTAKRTLGLYLSKILSWVVNKFGFDIIKDCIRNRYLF